VTHGFYEWWTLGKQDNIPKFEGSYQSIMLFVIGRIIKVAPWNFSLKLEIGWQHSNKTTPMPTPGASHSNSKAFEKLGKARTITLVSRESFGNLFLVFHPNEM